MDDAELWQGIEASGPLSWADNPPEPPPGVDADEWMERTQSQAGPRRTFIAFYGWSVPDRRAIGRIREFVGDRALLEVCAGNGLWARLLSGTGVRVTATDAAPVAAASLVPIEVLEAEAAVRAHVECTALMLSWPPFRSDAAYRALRTFGGDRLVYTGDARFCADERFHALIDTGWRLEERLPLPTWPGLADHVDLYVARD
jgi:hypothetical protein